MTTAGELSGMFGLLGSMYLCKPSKEALAGWRDFLRGASSLPFLGDVRNALECIHADSEREMEDLLWDYTRLFLGPYRLPCPPWESVYTSPKRLMMQEAYGSVSDFYRQAGLAIGDPNVAQDHVGAELSFLALLYGRMEAEPSTTPVQREFAERFLEEHLRRWIPAFSEDMERVAETPLYKALARTTRERVAAG